MRPSASLQSHHLAPRPTQRNGGDAHAREDLADSASRGLNLTAPMEEPVAFATVAGLPLTRRRVRFWNECVPVAKRGAISPRAPTRRDGRAAPAKSSEATFSRGLRSPAPSPKEPGHWHARCCSPGCGARSLATVSTEQEATVHGFWQDLRYGVRQLAQQRVITIVTVLTLGLGNRSQHHRLQRDQRACSFGRSR